MALAATPFGAAMLDKPTRGRLVRYVQVHAKKEKQTLGESMRLVPREKDWGADTALMELWDDAFKFFSVRDATRVLKNSLTINRAYVEGRKTLKAEYEAYKEDYYDFYSYSKYASEKIIDMERDIRKFDTAYRNSLPLGGLTLLELNEKYGGEIVFNNDLVRIAAQPEVPVFDFLALTAYTSK